MGSERRNFHMFYKMLVSFSHYFHFTTLNIKLCCNCARVKTVAEDEEIKSLINISDMPSYVKDFIYTIFIIFQ